MGCRGDTATLLQEWLADERQYDIDTEHGRILHRWMSVESLLDLSRIDVEAAGNHHVLLAIHDIEIAIFIAPREIADAEPTVPQGFARRVGSPEVSVEQEG